MDPAMNDSSLAALASNAVMHPATPWVFGVLAVGGICHGLSSDMEDWCNTMHDDAHKEGVATSDNSQHRAPSPEVKDDTFVRMTRAGAEAMVAEHAAVKANNKTLLAHKKASKTANKAMKVYQKILQNQIATLEAQKRTELEERAKEITGLESSLSFLEASKKESIADMQGKHNAVMEELTHEKTEVSRLRDNLTEVEHTKQKEIDDLKAIERTLRAQLIENCAAAKKELDDRVSKLDAMTTKHDSLVEAHDQLKTISGQQAAKLQDQLDAVTKERDALTQKSQSLQEERNQAVAKVTNEEKKYDSLVKELEASKDIVDDRDKLHHHLKLMRAKCKILDEKQETDKTTIEDLNAANFHLTKKMGRIRADLVRKYEASNAEIVEERETIRNQLRTMEAKCTKLVKHKETVKTATADLNAEKLDLIEKNGQIHAELQRVNSENDRLKQDKEELVSQLEQLFTTKGQIETELQQVNSEKTHLEKDKKDLESELYIFRMDYELRETDQKELEQLTKTNGRIGAELQQANSTIASLTEEIDYLESSLSSLKGAKDEELASMHAKFEAAKEELHGAKEQVEGLKTDGAEFSSKLSSFESAKDTEIDGLKANENTLRLQFDKERADAATQQKVLQGQLDRMKAHKDGLVKEGEASKSTIIELEAERDRAVSAAQNLQAEKDRLEEVVEASKKETIARNVWLQRSTAKDKTELEKLRTKNMHLEQTAKNDKIEIKQLTDVSASLQDSLLKNFGALDKSKADDHEVQKEPDEVHAALEEPKVDEISTPAKPRQTPKLWLYHEQPKFIPVPSPVKPALAPTTSDNGLQEEPDAEHTALDGLEADTINTLAKPGQTPRMELNPSQPGFALSLSPPKPAPAPTTSATASSAPAQPSIFSRLPASAVAPPTPAQRNIFSVLGGSADASPAPPKSFIFSAPTASAAASQAPAKPLHFDENYVWFGNRKADDKISTSATLPQTSESDNFKPPAMDFGISLWQVKSFTNAPPTPVLGLPSPAQIFGSSVLKSPSHATQVPNSSAPGSSSSAKPRRTDISKKPPVFCGWCGERAFDNDSKHNIMNCRYKARTEGRTEEKYDRFTGRQRPRFALQPHNIASVASESQKDQNNDNKSFASSARQTDDKGSITAPSEKAISSSSGTGECATEGFVVVEKPEETKVEKQETKLKTKDETKGAKQDQVKAEEKDSARGKSILFSKEGKAPTGYDNAQLRPGIAERLEKDNATPNPTPVPPAVEKKGRKGGEARPPGWTEENEKLKKIFDRSAAKQYNLLELPKGANGMRASRFAPRN